MLLITLGLIPKHSLTYQMNNEKACSLFHQQGYRNILVILKEFSLELATPICDDISITKKRQLPFLFVNHERAIIKNFHFHCNLLKKVSSFYVTR